MQLPPNVRVLGTESAPTEPDPRILAKETELVPPNEGVLEAALSAYEQELGLPLERWLRDPVAWAAERMHVELHAIEREILNAVRDHDETAVHSCHNIGKSFTAALCACWWIDAHPPGEAFVVTTAPTDKQVSAILWREMNRLHAGGDLPGRMNLKEWYVGNEMVAFGRKPADYDPDAFQGIHALGGAVMVVLDEACGIPKALWDAASTLISSEGSRALAIGNPDDPNSHFARVCKPDSGWHVIQVGYERTPNFTGEPVAPKLARSLISVGWVEKKRREWGEGSALFVSKCLGRFPEDESAFTCVPGAWALACRHLELPPSEPVEMGVDVGQGSDRTVLRERRGPKAGREEILLTPDASQAEGAIILKIHEWGVSRIKIDATGPGWALFSNVRDQSTRHNPGPHCTHGAEVVAVKFGNGARESSRFLNVRAELYWEVGRELSRLKLWDLEAVDDDTLAELSASRYQILDNRGRVKIEPKDDVIKRLGVSPDRAEALLLAYYEGHAPAEVANASALLTTAMY